MMTSCDVILIDLQDVGCRIYTFITTLLYILEAAVECEALEAGSSLGLSAVIEESKSTSYWALGHSDGAPDFHDRACFLARLTE